MAKLILASSSPRRKEVLTALGLDFETLSPEVDETSADHLPAAQRVIALARLKAGAAAALTPPSPGEEGLILAADTLVALDPLPSPPPRGISLDGVLGKAKDRAEARAMIEALAGRSHAVHTGLALLSLASQRLDTILSSSRVDFAPMSNKEIEAYLDYGDWEGVAGAYRIQGRAALHIRAIEGSWSGIVGLPIHELYVMLGRNGFPL
jgi:septum formation protein